MRIRRFNESTYANRLSEIEHIFNIARDEGLVVTTWDESNEHGFEPCQYYIDRYPMDNHGNAMYTYEPIVNNERFVEIVKDIYNRLKSMDLIDDGLTERYHQDFNTIFYGNGGNEKIKIEEFILEKQDYKICWHINKKQLR